MAVIIGVRFADPPDIQFVSSWQGWRIGITDDPTEALHFASVEDALTDIRALKVVYRRARNRLEFEILKIEEAEERIAILGPAA